MESFQFSPLIPRQRINQALAAGTLAIALFLLLGTTPTDAKGGNRDEFPKPTRPGTAPGLIAPEFPDGETRARQLCGNCRQR